MIPSLTDQSVEARRTARAGFFFALAAYLSWGFMPLYYAALKHVSPWAIVAHRVVWTVVFLILMIALQRNWLTVRSVLKNKNILWALVVSAILIGVNWFVFVYSITSERLTHAALGYYINPLVSVMLGFIVLRERPRTMQWICVAIATFGVLLSILALGEFPWIAITLAFSFGLYGLVRKVVPIGAVIGLFFEASLLAPFCMIYLLYTWGRWSVDPAASLSFIDYILLLAAGIVTPLPLIWFTAGVRRLTLTTIGIMQYIAPTAQLFVAATFLTEPFIQPEVPFLQSKLGSFTFIWIALAIFAWDSYTTHRRLRSEKPVEMVE